MDVTVVGWKRRRVLICSLLIPMLMAEKSGDGVRTHDYSGYDEDVACVQGLVHKKSTHEFGVDGHKV